MKKYLISILFLLVCFVGFSQTYDPTKATVSNKPYGMAQAFPTDARSFFYDATNFLWRAYQSTTEVKTYLNLAKYRAGNFFIIVDSGGTLNGNGTYTGGINTIWMFRDGVLDANLIELNLTGGGNGCSTCFFTTTQLTDSSFKLNRPNGTSDTVVIDFVSGVYIATANNFLTLTGTNVQAGGPLVQDTYANGGGHVFGITGNIFEQGQGAAIASANVMTTGSDGNSFPVIGSTQINAITTTNRQPGTIISFTFTGTPLLRNNQVAPAGSAPLLLAGGVDYTAATNDVIFFLYDGVANVWHETSRKLAGSVIAVNANNAVTLAGSLLQWGGTLVKPTTVAGNLFPTFFSGGRVEMPMGLPILAAGDLVPGNDGIFFHITGTTQINAISTTNFQAGAELSFVFDNIVTVKNNTVGGINTAPMLLAGRVDYTSAVGDYIAFHYDGVNWYETNRKLSGSTTSITASNGLTLTGSNIVLGGSFTGGTTITQGAFQMTWNGSAGGFVDRIQSTGTGAALLIASTGGGNGISSSATGGAVGVQGGSDTGQGIFGFSGGAAGIGVAGTITVTGNGYGVFGKSNIAGSWAIGAQEADVSTNSVIALGQFARTTSSTAADGIGFSLDLANQTTVGTKISNQIISKWTTANDATRTSQLSFTGVNSGTTNVLATLDGVGDLTLNGTGVGLTTILGTTGIVATGSNIGILAQSPTIGLQANSTSTTNNAAVEVLRISRQAGYTGLSGVGGKITWDLENSLPSDIVTGFLQNQLTTATAGSETSQFDFSVLNAGSNSIHFSVGGAATFTTASRFELSKGAPVVSANNLTLGTDGNVFHITGVTTINAITTANWQAGSVITLIFDGSLTVKNNTAGGGGTAVMKLAGAADFSATADDVLTLVWDGNIFYERCRSVN